MSGPLPDWIESLAATYGSEGPQSVVTTAHREIVRARDRNWERFIHDLDSNFGRLDHHFGRLEVDEQRWQATWQGLVEALCRDNRDSEK